jgi:hypothetical protein
LTDTSDNKPSPAPRPSPVGKFLGSVSEELQKNAVKYVAGLILVGIGAVVWAAWAEIRTRTEAFVVAAVLSELETRDSEVAGSLTDKIVTDLGRSASRLAQAVDARIVQRIDSNVGAVVAGSFTLDEVTPRFTIPFYLPADHLVDLELYISGLENQRGEVLRITTPNPQEIAATSGTITRNGPGSVRLHQPSAELRDNPDLNPLGAFRPIMGRVEHLFPVTITLTRSAADPTGTAPLQSRVTVEYVGLLSPPIQRD